MKLFLALIVFVHPTLSNTVCAFAQVVKPQPSEEERARRVRLRCEPRRVWRGDTLVLAMSVPHGRDLAVISPGGNFFWLRYWEPGDQKITRQWYAFESQRRLELVTGEAKGNVGGKDELIFTKTGWYRIRLGYNLETDDGTPFAECRVHYVHRRKGAQRPPARRRG